MYTTNLPIQPVEIELGFNELILTWDALKDSDIELLNNYLINNEIVISNLEYDNNLITFICPPREHNKVDPDCYIACLLIGCESRRPI